MKTRQTYKATRSGFTLLEVLLVLAILGVIAALVVPQLIGRLSGTKIDATKISIKAIEAQLKVYSVDHEDTFPEGSGQETMLQYLTQPDEIKGRTIPPYLDIDAMQDPWGEYFYYEYPTQKTPNNGLKPAIWSAGPNKQNEQGQGDDITSWKKNNK